MKSLNIKKFIEVGFQKEGIHKYPAAATDPKLKTGKWDDVSFLANDHSHIFHFWVRISVDHSDRDIEFIQFKRWLEYKVSKRLDLNYRSCEMLAEELAEVILKRYPGRELEIRISEDGHQGAVLQFTEEEVEEEVSKCSHVSC